MSATSRRCRSPISPKQGAITGHSELIVTGQGPGFGAQVVDVEVDKETGRVKVLRHTVFADAGKAIHPMQLEGQFQGAVVQGTGWALNEEYVYGADGRLQNPELSRLPHPGRVRR